MAAADGTVLVFDVSPIELETLGAVGCSVGAEAQEKFWVVEAETDGRVGATGMRWFKSSLAPGLPGWGGSPSVSGPSLPAKW